MIRAEVLARKQETREASAKHGERRDCAVVAISLVTNVPYREVLGMLDVLGRKKGHGTFQPQTLACLKMLGFEVNKTFRPKQPNGSGYTIKSISKDYPIGTYLVSIRHHILAMVNGKILDWSEDTKYHVRQIIRVTPKHNSVPSHTDFSWLEE